MENDTDCSTVWYAEAVAEPVRVSTPLEYDPEMPFDGVNVNSSVGSAPRVMVTVAPSSSWPGSFTITTTGDTVVD